MHDKKFKAIQDWPKPKNIKELQSFLGFANFYRKFIENYSKITKPMTKLISKDTPFQWTDDANNSFNELKTKFASAPLLAHPNLEQPYFLETDASNFAISGILSQYDSANIKPHPVAFHSRQLLPAEINYDVYDKELLAIIECMKHWRHHLLGAKFPITIFTDHRNLQYFATARTLNRRQARWAQFIADFNFFIVY
jgi:hypothetical protein